MLHSLSIFRIAAWWLFRRLPKVLVLFLCALWVAGCGSTVPESRSIPPERVFNVCWKPPELGPGVYFDFRTESGLAASTSGEENPRHIKYVFKYAEDAPASNLRLLPLSRVDAWCPHIPQPSLLEVPAFEPEPAPCPVPVSIEERLSDARLLFGQTSDVPIRSPFFCDKQPRVAFTPQELMLMRARNLAYQLAYEQACKAGKALAQACADMEEVVNKDRSWLKRAFTSDPGSLEQIQQRITDALNSIEELPEYSDPGLDSLAMAGYQLGFENGKFEVEAKLFAIDAGILILEVVALEIALGPLGGAKLLASAATKGTKAMKAAFTRVGNIPIFIPGATNGLGGFVRARHVLKALNRYHARRLEAAMFAEAKLTGKPLVKLATEETHHVVPPGVSRREAQKCRDILAKFDIDIDHPANGVFLPANKSSPNPTGAIVHKILGNNEDYYRRMLQFLEKSTSQADAIRRLRRIGETLRKGTFFNAPL